MNMIRSRLGRPLMQLYNHQIPIKSVPTRLIQTQVIKKLDVTSGSEQDRNIKLLEQNNKIMQDMLEVQRQQTEYQRDLYQRDVLNHSIGAGLTITFLMLCGCGIVAGIK